ncbi:hypothetical protein [Bradyrhizobium tropiciagri]|uniref:hypothetical protein n=1 Tax=Bradyrhizobium tropiciagri TaxID=312253 RepID=UPI000A969F0A|nr:hypothetical protein [Bradyrhizobium tropiciagri]
MNVKLLKRTCKEFGRRHQPRSVLAEGQDRFANSSSAEMPHAEICSIGKLSFLMDAHDEACGTIAEHDVLKDCRVSMISIGFPVGYARAHNSSPGQLVSKVKRIEARCLL